MYHAWFTVVIDLRGREKMQAGVPSGGAVVQNRHCRVKHVLYSPLENPTESFVRLRRG